MKLSPLREEFLTRVAQGETAIPVFCEIVADTMTPVGAFAAVSQGQPHAFLLESVVGGARWAEASFVGGRPHAVVRVSLGSVDVDWMGGASEHIVTQNPATALREFLGRFRGGESDGLPRFWGGLVGYLGYDLVRTFERLRGAGSTSLPEGLLVLSDELVIFDNLRHTVKLLAVALVTQPGEAERAYEQACSRVAELAVRLQRPVRVSALLQTPRTSELPPSTFPKAAFLSAVNRAREYIAAGDIVQVVLSQRFVLPRGDIDPLALYRALRVINPSPYLYYLRFPEVSVAGASPEVMVRLDGRQITLRPIAGTRRRSSSPVEDAQLEAELLADPKERAEHVMLVDLGRNDVGRVARKVQVPTFMTVERYSHVMHLVSDVIGTLAPEYDAWDLLRATFPAGTLTGAPKIRAMQIIDELEPHRRGIYGGAVGYVSYSGHMDLAIAIRTLVVSGDSIWAQAGAGVVYDSKPAREYDETLEKAQALLTAVAMAR